MLSESMPNAPKQISQTDSWVKRLHEVTNDNAELVAALRPRLIPISRQENSAKEALAPKEEILVPLCAEIREAVNRIMDSNNLLQSIIDRLEI